MGNDCCKVSCPPTSEASWDPNFVDPGRECPHSAFYFYNDPTKTKITTNKICGPKTISYDPSYKMTCPCNGEWGEPQSGGGKCYYDSDKNTKGSSCAIDCGGSGLCGMKSSCPKGSSGTDHCQIMGQNAECKRKGYNGDPASCCLLAGSGTTNTYPGTNNRKYGNSKAPDPSWDAMGGTNYTCDPSTSDWQNVSGNSPCPGAIANMCSKQDPATQDQWGAGGYCDNYVSNTSGGYPGSASTVMTAALTNFLQTNSVDCETDQDCIAHGMRLCRPNTKGQKKCVALSSTNQAPYVHSLLQNCNKYAGMCDSLLNSACSGLSRTDVSNAYDASANDPGAANLYQACGCHLAQKDYNNWPGVIDENSYNACDPLCKLPGSIPKGTGGGNPASCEQSICLLDNISIDIINSNVSDGVNFNTVCSGCEEGENCLCVFSNISIFSQGSNLGGINFNTNCGQCAIQDPSDPTNISYVDCKTGQPIGNGNGTPTPPPSATCKVNADCSGNLVCHSGSCVPPSTQQSWWEENKKNIMIYGGIALGILVLIVLGFTIFGSKGDDDSYEGDSLSAYFDQ